jgi:Mg-chelatase subunit ChlD
VDVCYCEAKHVQSFYASIARGQERDFDCYEDRVLILDEVDALVIDEGPNEAFVYPNKELSRMATSCADMLKKGATPQDLDMLRSLDHPSSQRVCREVVEEWNRGMKMNPGEQFVYSKEIGRYIGLQSGRANPKAWSLALECRNFQDGLSREIMFQERLFVMSRPRVFRKYYRILGLSGSIGSEAERSFLKQTYSASFFEVPPFLKTCRGSPFHEPVPVPLGDLRRAVYVEETPEAQLKRLAEVALTAREKVPVLVIAKDRSHSDFLVEGLRNACRSRGLGGNSHDLVRSLARTLYEADPEQWKENLNRSTLPLGDGQHGGKAWRITVTDPRGGRGTDYRVDFRDVDDAGGLLLIPTMIPTSQRDWTQFLGRTARQDRKGQYCAVLCATDYDKLSRKYKEPLPVRGGLDTIEAVLSWGDREVAERIRKSAALYNCGVRMNELCEIIFSKQQHVLDCPEVRERMVDVCQRHRFMSVQEIDAAFSKILNVEPSTVPTSARDMGRPAEPPGWGVDIPHAAIPKEAFGRKASFSAAPPLAHVQGITAQLNKVEVPRFVVFCIDWSASMMSQDTGKRGETRFGACIDRVQRILQEQVRENDIVSVVGFGASYETSVQPTSRGHDPHRIEKIIGSLKPSTAGGTCFFDAVAHSLRMLKSSEHAPLDSPRWLICLTDGDDIGSRKENENGEVVARMLNEDINKLNMIMITVGKLKANNLRIISSWTDQVARSGGHGQHLSEKDAVSIGKAFEVVAEALAADVGGAIEC